MIEELFDDVIELPNVSVDERFNNLVGLDKEKELILKEGKLLLHPDLLDKWSQGFHSELLPIVTFFKKRPPLMLFSGDVGTGKSTLANSFGSALARAEKTQVTLVQLSLKTRGQGSVGEMTSLITQAFAEVESLAMKLKGGAVIFVIDEADALAETRENSQMHHEDRAGVNALIRGIDKLAASNAATLIVLCTNRETAMDPAILRRVAVHHQFHRPNDAQRLALLTNALGTILKVKELQTVADLLGPVDGRGYGYTYSDITQRLMPRIVLECFPDKAVTFKSVMVAVESVRPTAPFESRTS